MAVKKPLGEHKDAELRNKQNGVLGHQANAILIAVQCYAVLSAIHRKFQLSFNSDKTHKPKVCDQ